MATDFDFIKTQLANITYSVQRFNGTGSQAEFPLAEIPASDDLIAAFINGVLQPNTNFSLSGQSVVFSAAPPSGVGNVEIVVAPYIAHTLVNAEFIVVGGQSLSDALAKVVPVYGTYAQAQAAAPGLQDGQLEVDVDETRNGRRTIYSIAAGSLTFSRFADNTVCVADFGGVAGVDCSAALILAAAATSGSILIPGGAWQANATSANTASILGLLNRIRCDGTLTINIDAGLKNLTNQIVVNSPDAHRIQVIGAAPVQTTATGQISVSGSAKNYSVTIGVASSAGAAVGDYVLIRTDVSGTGDYDVHAGMWRITAVNSGGANRLTLRNTHHGAAFPANTLTGGTVVILKTVLKFTGSDGFRFEGGQPIGLLNRVAVIGDYDVAAGTGTLYAHGLVMAAPVIVGGASSNATHNMTGSAILGESVGFADWGEQGIAVSGRCTLLANFVASCSNRKRGWYAEGGHIRNKFAVSNGNGEDGFISDIGGDIQANNSIASGNGINGFWSTNASMLACASSIASGNLAHAFEARGVTRLNADGAIARNNGGAGFNANDGGMIDADFATASGNAAHGFDAGSGGIIDCDNSTSTGNTGYGYRSQYGSVVRASGATVSGNTIGDYRCYDSVLFESSGALRPQDATAGMFSQRIYNAARSHYCDIALSSLGDVTISIDGSARQTIKIGAGTKIIGSTPTTSAGELGLGSTTSTTVGATGAASALPANPLGYLTVSIGGSVVKVPYYNS